MGFVTKEDKIACTDALAEWLTFDDTITASLPLVLSEREFDFLINTFMARGYNVLFEGLDWEKFYNDFRSCVDVNFEGHSLRTDCFEMLYLWFNDRTNYWMFSPTSDESENLDSFEFYHACSQVFKNSILEDRKNNKN